VDRCGLDIPITPATDLLSRAVWTATVQKAAVYIAFAKAYVPPIPGLSNGSAVGFGSYGAEVKPICGVSLAVVGKATMQDQLGQDAGTAYFTDELLWCAINGTNINDAFDVSQTPEGGTRLITPEVVPNCLPYSTIRVQPAKQAQPPVNPGPRLPAPEPALSPAPGANLLAGAGCTLA
jgi:hypothetical protein